MVVDFVGRIANTIDDIDTSNNNGSIFHQASDWMVIIAEKDVVPCLELAIRFMSLQETALVWSHSKYALGSYGRTDTQNKQCILPANTNVCYTVTVKEIISQEERETPEFALRAAQMKKSIANDMYLYEWNGESPRNRVNYLYNRALSYADQVLTQEDCNATVHDQARTIQMDCLNNIAAVHMRAKEYHLAKTAAIRVLEKDPNNVKALLRAAKASLLDPASAFEEVEAAIQAAEEVAGSSEDKAVQAIRSDFRRRKQDYKKKQKEIMAKMSKALGSNDKTVTAGLPEDSKSIDNDGDANTEEHATPTSAAESGEEKEEDFDVTLDKLKMLQSSLEDVTPVSKSIDWRAVSIQFLRQVMLPMLIICAIRYFQGTGIS